MERNKNDPFFWNVTRTILFGMKQERTFLEMGKSSSNVPNVFQGSPLTGTADIDNRGGYLLHSLIFRHSWRIFKDFQRR